jgi:hypothetical protein
MSSNPHTPRPQRIIHHARDSEAEWADSVLGTDFDDHSVLSHSLQTEVDAYFLDTVTSSYTSIMTFWQVSMRLRIVLLTFTQIL